MIPAKPRSWVMVVFVHSSWSATKLAAALEEASGFGSFFQALLSNVMV
jgi:hypothetical protein